MSQVGPTFEDLRHEQTTMMKIVRYVNQPFPVPADAVSEMEDEGDAGALPAMAGVVS